MSSGALSGGFTVTLRVRLHRVTINIPLPPLSKLMRLGLRLVMGRWMGLTLSLLRLLMPKPGRQSPPFLTISRGNPDE